MKLVSLDVDGVGLEHDELGHCNVQKVRPPQYPVTMHMDNNFLDDQLPETSVDAINAEQNFDDLLNITSWY